MSNAKELPVKDENNEENEILARLEVALENICKHSDEALLAHREYERQKGLDLSYQTGLTEADIDKTIREEFAKLKADKNFSFFAKKEVTLGALTENDPLDLRTSSEKDT